MKFVERKAETPLIAIYVVKTANTETTTERPIVGYDDVGDKLIACVVGDEGSIVHVQSIKGFAGTRAAERPVLGGRAPSLFESVFGPSIFR